MNRISALQSEVFDVVIVGGGIIGAGIARDAALRGLKVALFEQRDFGSGTTAGSTRLIHGGLRYLEMLDFRLVRLDLRERETLLRIAPHLIKPLEFVIPFYRRSLAYRAKMRLGMAFYDLLSYDKSLTRHRFLSPGEIKAIEPNLRQENLQGAALYFDAQVDSPERLCLENILDAREHRAQTFNYAEVIGALQSGETITGVRVRDLLSDDGDIIEVRGRVVVNAAGAWFDRVARKITATATRRIRTTKGIHVACPQVNRRAVVLFSPIDGRLVFVIPWLGHSWIGTTDTDFEDDPARAQATAGDVDYLRRSVAPFFPTLDIRRVYFSNAGVRALVKKEGSESSVSRMHRVSDGEREKARRLISVLGGKITGYRAIAEEATDLICVKLNVKSRCLTAALPLPGARAAMTPPDARTEDISRETVEHLFNLYGSRATEVLRLATEDARWREPLTRDVPDIAAQVVFAARTEQCARLSDFILRRTLLGFRQDQGVSAAPRAAALLAREFCWTQARSEDEMRTFREHVARTQTFRDERA